METNSLVVHDAYIVQISHKVASYQLMGMFRYLQCVSVSVQCSYLYKKLVLRNSS